MVLMGFYHCWVCGYYGSESFNKEAYKKQNGNTTKNMFFAEHSRFQTEKAEVGYQDNKNEKWEWKEKVTGIKRESRMNGHNEAYTIRLVTH